MVIDINTATSKRKANDDFVTVVDAKELVLGDQVGMAKWTIETLDINNTRVLATGHNSRGDRFVLNSKTNKPVRVWS